LAKGFPLGREAGDAYEFGLEVGKKRKGRHEYIFVFCSPTTLIAKMKRVKLALAFDEHVIDVVHVSSVNCYENREQLQNERHG